LQLEELENRLQPSVVLSNGMLTITGDQTGNAVDVHVSGSDGVTAVLNGNTFSYNPGAVASVDVEGGNGVNTLTVGGGARSWAVNSTFGGAATVNGLAVNFHNVQNIGGDDANNDIFQFFPGGYVSDVNGGGGGNTLVGPSAASTFAITGANSGLLVGAAADFHNINTLIGGSASDHFYFGPNGYLSGYIDGGGGGDVLDYTYGNAAVVGLVGPGAIDGFGGVAAGLGVGFTNIDAIVGSAASGVNVLYGTNAASTWILDANGDGYLSEGRALVFGRFQYLIGGAGNDLFAVHATPAGSVTYLYGGAGDDSFQFSSDAPFDKGVTAGLRGPVVVDGGPGVNQLVVSDAGDPQGGFDALTPNEVLGAVAPNGIYFTATGGSFAGGVYLLTGSGDDLVYVVGTPGGATTTLLTGAGNDVIAVTAQNGTLAAALGGPLIIDAGPGANVLSVSEPNNVGDSITVTPNSITGSSGFAIYYTATGGKFAAVYVTGDLAGDNGPNPPTGGESGGGGDGSNPSYVPDTTGSAGSTVVYVCDTTPTCDNTTTPDCTDVVYVDCGDDTVDCTNTDDYTM
jgi:hypothetical protein